MQKTINDLGIDVIVLELSKFTEISSQKRYDVIHGFRPIPIEWINNYYAALQKELDDYVNYQNFDKHFEEVLQWQQDVLYNSLFWNWLLKNGSVVYEK